MVAGDGDEGGWNEICGVNDIIDMSKFESDKVCMFDCLSCNWLFVWIGKDCPGIKKRDPLMSGGKYLEDNGRTVRKIRMICCVEGSEPKQFWTAIKKQQWKIVRLIWIGYLKNEKNKKCLFVNLPKDIIIHVIKLIA